MTTTIAFLDASAASWRTKMYAFLAEKQRRSGSMRIEDTYSLMLRASSVSPAKTPDQVASQDVFAWAYSAECIAAAVGSKPSVEVTTDAAWNEAKG